MLIINWKKHYNIPTIFYNDTRFTSTRKGKFFFLSDFVFKVIHKFCFKISLFYYMKYLFFYRFQKICKHVNKYLFSPFYYLSQQHLKWSMSFLGNYLSKNSPFFYKIKKKFLFLRHFYFFLSLSSLLKIEMIKKKWVLFFFKKKISKKWTLQFHYFTLFSFFNLLKWIKKRKQNIIPYKNKNLYFLLYQLKYLRLLLKNYSFFYLMEFNFQKIYNKYIKNYFFYNDLITKKLKKESNILKKKYISSMEKLKMKNIFYVPFEWHKNYYIYFNFFINNFHNLFYYFFSLKKIYSFKTLHLINYVNLNNLVLKKEFFYKFKNLFISFKRKFRRFRLYYMKRFYKFLINVLYSKKNWLLGHKQKFKFFKYIFLIFRKIKKAFKKLYFLNQPKYKKKKKMSFFFNSIKIREHLFYYLGKKRYREEFLLLKNKKWYLKFYLKQYYNIDFKFINNFYLSLRKKFKLKWIKDLFLFLEYNIAVFTKKYIFFSFNFFYDMNWNNITLNNFSISSEKKNIFFIGDCIQMNTKDLKYKYYYEKFFIFFNIIYYMNPFFYKKKFLFLNHIYKKLYDYIKNDFLKRHFLLTDNKKIRFSKSSFLSNKYIYWFVNQLNIRDYKLYIKSLFFFIFKFQFSYNKNNNNNNTLDTNFFFENWNWENLIYIYSFCKTYDKFFLVELHYMNQRKKKLIRKPFFIFRNIKRNKNYFRRKRRKWIKKKLNMNLYSYFYRDMTPSLNNTQTNLYNKSFYNKWPDHIHSIYIWKKLFFLKKKNNFFHFFYNNNF